MSIKDCLDAAVAAGKLTAKGAAEYTARMADAERKAAQRGIVGPAAYAFAATEAAKAMEKRATRTRQQIQQTILAVDRAWASAKANRSGTFWGLTSVFAERVKGDQLGDSITQQHWGNLSTMQSIASDMLSRLQSRAFGLKGNQILPRHTLSAIYGRTVSDPAAQTAAAAWEKLITWWRDEMGRAGITVPELKDWRIFQHWDDASVRYEGPVKFRDQMLQWWQDDKLRIRDWEADGEAYFAYGLPDAENRVRDIINKAYANITSGGDASLEPGAAKYTSMADRYGRRRAFEWTTDEAWLEFNGKYGVGNEAIGEGMIRHIDRMARDLAVAKVLGPDPDRAARTLIEMYLKEGAGRKATLGVFGPRMGANKLTAMYEISSGKASTPVSNVLALRMQGLRSGLAAAQLGGAVLSAASDFGFVHATAAWHGLSMTRIMMDYLSRIGPGTREGRAEAMRSGLILEVGLRGLQSVAHEVIGDVASAPGIGGKIGESINGLARIAGRMAEVVIRGQGLAHHTQIMRDAIGAEIQAHFGDAATRAWSKLEDVDRRTLQSYGLNEKHWDVLRTKALVNGVLDPAALARETQVAAPGKGFERDAAVKFLGMIGTLQRIGVPEANSVTRAMMLGGTKVGTPEGEILRSLVQYKGFPMSAFMMHYFRAIEPLRDGEGAWSRAQYVAGLVISTTVLGALTLQLRNIAAGKDPEPMFKPDHAARFWASAFATGGAGGIAGSQMQSLFSAQRIGDAARLATPVTGLMLDLQSLFQGNLQDTIAGREPHMGREVVRFANKYTPHIFYTKLAMDRLFWDTLQRMADPDAAGTFARMMDHTRQVQQTNYYWQPGHTSPSRSPDFNRALYTGAGP